MTFPIVKAEPISGFAPDDEPAKPGVVTDCTNMLPTTNGMKAAAGFAYGPVQFFGTYGVASYSFTARNTTGQPKYLLAYQTTLLLVDASYVAVATTVSARGGPWHACQFGDYTIAAAYGGQIMAANVGSTFSAVASSPAAAIVCSSDDFVMAFDNRAAGGAGSGDYWACSAFRNPLDWTPSLATQATTGRLVSSGGNVTAALALGSQVIAYKKDALFVGTYVGSPTVWQWERIPGRAGCVGRNAVCDIGGAHFFVGGGSFWIYDGTRPVRVGTDAVTNWFFARIGIDGDVACYYDRDRTSVFIWHTLSGVSGNATALVYNVTTGTFGRMSPPSAGAQVVARLPINTTGLALLDERMAVITNTGAIYLENASTQPDAAPSLTTRSIGDDTDSTRLLDARLIYANSAGSAAPSVEGFTGSTPASVSTAGQASIPESAGKFSVRQHARWHRLKFTFGFDATTRPEVRAITVNGIKAGAK